jgi:hypothetical protein
LKLCSRSGKVGYEDCVKCVKCVIARPDARLGKRGSVT